MEKLLGTDCEDPKMLNPLSLAFLGDGVYGLFVREKLICEKRCKVGSLHKDSVAYVCCEAQAKAAEKLIPLFTEEEKSIYLRARNAHSSHVPKNSTVGTYHAATALEAVFGYLYLKNETERLRMFFEEICGEN